MFTGARFVQTEAEHRLRELLCNGAIRRHLVGGKRPFDPNIIIYIRETR